MFDGKMKDFRSEGGIVKTDSEKREMAQKHRFKKEREFKKRVSEETENEDDDIRSFKFHTHRLDDFEKRREEIRRGGQDHVRQDAATTTTMTGRCRVARVSKGKRDRKRFEGGDKRGGFKGDRMEAESSSVEERGLQRGYDFEERWRLQNRRGLRRTSRRTQRKRWTID